MINIDIFMLNEKITIFTVGSALFLYAVGLGFELTWLYFLLNYPAVEKNTALVGRNSRI